MSLVVAQLGARMHYAVPRLLERAGLLERLYTDICAVKDWPRLLRLIPPALRPGGVQRLLGRDPKGIPARRITAFTAFGYDYARRSNRARTTDERNAAFLWSGREFCRLVVERGFGAARAVYVFNSAGLEILQAARPRGLKGVVEQTIAPRSIEWALLRDEAQRFPGWETPAAKDSMMEDYCAREAAEWAAADLVVCGSEFVREGIVNCGGAAEKCVVVPYGLERAAESAPRAPRRAGPLRVLTVGAVGLRKGSPYVFDAARQLGPRAEFRMVGAVQVLPEAEKQLRAHVQLTGVVPRTEVAAHYAWADVFLLPSLCEGSATSIYEAMFQGLPVVCTPSTGSVVRDGVDGFIVPPRDGALIAEKLALLAGQPRALAEMSAHARQRAADFTLEKYGERLIAAFRQRGVIGT
jgi:glycosyltransferase involved in cell wall biosynthesis